jgi:hypothetical protein
MGVVLRDFNYNQSVAWHSKMVKSPGMMLVNYDVYMSWGDRCEAARQPDPELSHMVCDLAAWDQIIWTPDGEPVPPLHGELAGHAVAGAGGLNLERKEMDRKRYQVQLDELMRQINTRDTYTMCFWGASQVIDFLGWQFKFGTTIPMSNFFGDSPIHVAMYELLAERDSKAPGLRHLESRKQYYLDFMFWSSSCGISSSLASRYVFMDPALGDHAEAEACPPFGSSGSGEEAVKDEASQEEPATPGLLQASGVSLHLPELEDKVATTGGCFSCA